MRRSYREAFAQSRNFTAPIPAFRPPSERSSRAGSRAWRRPDDHDDRRTTLAVSPTFFSLR
jgi:hypothetical protein